jgi:crotonobetainyl-CoA:carnitine CoA-transferase CaiB-like acyl-CoA transferase
VLVENFRPRVKYRLKIDPERALVLNPRLIYASISGFGQDGPYVNRPGVDQIAQGYSGLMSVTGPPGTGPWRVGTAVVDTATGMMATQGILAALVARSRTGRGQWIHTSLLETAINLMDFQAVRWLVDGEIADQAGNVHPLLGRRGGMTFRTADGHVNACPLGGLGVLCEALDLEPVVEDSSDPAGAERADDVRYEMVQTLMTEHTSAYWVDRLADVVPCGPVLRMDEVFADPQVGHLNLTRRVGTSTGQEVDVLRYPLTFSETPTSIRRPAPRPGGDTNEVLDELGLQASEVEKLVRAGVVGGPVDE